MSESTCIDRIVESMQQHPNAPEEWADTARTVGATAEQLGAAMLQHNRQQAHLVKARAARDLANLRAGMAKTRSMRQLKPCNCGAGDGVEWRQHKATCPVYNREKRKQ